MSISIHFFNDGLKLCDAFTKLSFRRAADDGVFSGAAADSGAERERVAVAIALAAETAFFDKATHLVAIGQSTLLFARWG